MGDRLGMADFMMSDPASEDVAPPMSSTPSAVPVSNVPVPSYFHSINPLPIMYYIPPTTQTWNVPAVAPQWYLSIIVPQNTNSRSQFLQTYLKGIVIIVAAIFEICSGIVLPFFHLAFTILTGIPFWGPVLYIIAGSLTIAARDNSSLIKRSLWMNIISSIFSMTAMILNVFDLVIAYLMSFPYHIYYIYVDIGFSDPQQFIPGTVIYCLLVVTNVLLFCVTIATAVSEYRSLVKGQVQSANRALVFQNDIALTMNSGAVPVTTTYAHPPPPAYSAIEVKA